MPAPQPDFDTLRERTELIRAGVKRVGREARILGIQAARLLEDIEGAADDNRQSEEDTRAHDRHTD